MAVGSQQSAYQLASFFMPLHGIYPAPLSCQSAYPPYATIIRRVRPWRRACTRGLSHIGFHAAAANCASSRHSILRLRRGPSPRAYSRGIISHGLSSRCGELCLFEALHPAPLARPFSKGLLEGDYLTWAFMPPAANCASSRHSILSLCRGSSPRAYAREEYSSP